MNMICNLQSERRRHTRPIGIAPARRGITLVEVIFSIGVVLIGLVGIAVIMPMAGNRARESVNMTVGASFGDAVFDELMLRGWLKNHWLIDYGNQEMVHYLKVRTGGPALTFSERKSLSVLPDDTPNDNVPFESFCIDPLYVGDRASQTEPALALLDYDDAFFPYYAPGHDPLLNPSATSTWPNPQPRMRRVGIRKITASDTEFFASVDLERARSIVERSSDLVLTISEDRAAKAQIEGLQIDSGLEYGRRAPSGEFSWIATVSPLPGNQHASVSVVVIRDRDRERDFPSALVTDPKSNGNNERLAYVTYAAGFKGGAGGVVHLVASGTTSSALRVGDWVMLSRRVTTGTPNVDVHRWYRVAAVDGKPERFIPADTNLLETGGAPLPGTTRDDQVWRHKVLLDGPDWAFNFTPSPRQVADNTFWDNTFATIVKGVVSVTERVVPLSDL